MNAFTIKEHIEALKKEDKYQDLWYVIFYDPQYSYARSEAFRRESEAREFYEELVENGRRPKLMHQTTEIITREVLS